jgi:periplasmic protein TonB
MCSFTRQSVDRLFIGLLVLSTALHAGLFMALKSWDAPMPRPTMPAVRISLSAPALRDLPSPPSLAGLAFPELHPRALRKIHLSREQNDPPPPSQPNLQTPDTNASEQRPLPALQPVDKPPELNLASEPAAAAQPQPSPRGQPRADATQPANAAPQDANQKVESEAARQIDPGPEMDTYLSRVMRQIERRKHYPYRARSRHIQGRISVGFAIQADGNIRALRILQSSGHRVLDRAALAAVTSASPFPRPPSRYLSSPLALRVDLIFSLEGYR